MKKSIRILALAMVTVVLCLALASCGGPNADPTKAYEALKENDGLVPTKTDADGGLFEAGAIALLKVAGVDNVTNVVSATGKIDGEFATVTIIYFESAADAKDEMEDAKKYANDDKDDDAKDSEWVFKQSGKMIWFGTKNAVKAAK